jgi:hypothetical protein
VDNKNNMTYYQKNKYARPFTPKKPVRSFRDLDVYQTAMGCAVIIAKDMKLKLARLKYDYLENMLNCSMSVPLYIGEAHSTRFADFKSGVSLLEKAMAGCNKMIVYLEAIKGVYGSKVDVSLVDDIIGRYAEGRTKMFHLEKSWKRFKDSNNEGASAQREGNFGTGTKN